MRMWQGKISIGKLKRPKVMKMDITKFTTSVSNALAGLVAAGWLQRVSSGELRLGLAQTQEASSATGLGGMERAGRLH